MSKFLFATTLLLLPFIIEAQTALCVAGYDAIMTDSTNAKLDYIDTYKNCEGIDFTFPINFVIVTDNESAGQMTSYRAMQDIVWTLNLYFSAEDHRNTTKKKKLINFELKSYVRYARAEGIGGDLFYTLDNARTYRGDYIEQSFDAEPSTVIRDPNAINIYIYDSGQDGDNGTDIGGHGRFNSGKPYILLDYTRINTRNQAPEEHEMGHAFGLNHICNSLITSSTQSSNIMTSGGSYPCDGSIGKDSYSLKCDCEFQGGKRDIGFTPEQAQVILENAVKIHDKLKL